MYNINSYYAPDSPVQIEVDVLIDEIVRARTKSKLVSFDIDYSCMMFDDTSKSCISVFWESIKYAFKHDINLITSNYYCITHSKNEITLIVYANNVPLSQISNKLNKRYRDCYLC